MSLILFSGSRDICLILQIFPAMYSKEDILTLQIANHLGYGHNNKHRCDRYILNHNDHLYYYDAEYSRY